MLKSSWLCPIRLCYRERSIIKKYKPLENHRSIIASALLAVIATEIKLFCFAGELAEGLLYFDFSIKFIVSE